MPNYMPLADGVDVTNIPVSVDLFAGEMPVVTDQGVIGSQALAQFQVLMYGASGDANKLVPWDNTPGTAVAIAATPLAANTALGPIYVGGFFNHQALVWPAAADTYAERRAAFSKDGTIRIGKLL